MKTIRFNRKLDGDVAEVHMPAAPWYARLWRNLFPPKVIEGKVTFLPALPALPVPPAPTWEAPPGGDPSLPSGAS